MKKSCDECRNGQANYYCPECSYALCEDHANILEMECSNDKNELREIDL